MGYSLGRYPFINVPLEGRQMNNEDKIVMTSREFYTRHVMDFNFELDEAQLLAEGLKRGFIVNVGDDAYEYGESYE